MSGFRVVCPENGRSESLGCRYWSMYEHLQRQVATLANCTQEEVVLVFRGEVLKSSNFHRIHDMDRSSEALVVASSPTPISDLVDLCVQFRSPLHFFCSLHRRGQPFAQRSAEVLATLLKADKRGDRGDRLSMPVVHYAIQIACEQRLFVALLAAGLDFLDSDGTSALHIAIDKGRLHICLCLLQADDQEALRRTPGGETTLHLAKSFEIAKALIDVAPELVNAVDCEGQTPIGKMLSSPGSRDDTSCELLRLLLSAGAKPPSELPSELGEVSRALLEESLEGFVSAAFQVAPWSTVQCACEDLLGWSGFQCGLLVQSFNSVSMVFKATQVCRAWHGAAWAYVMKNMPSVSWAQLRSLVPRAARFSRRSFNPDLIVSTHSFEEEASRLTKVPTSAQEDQRRRDEEIRCSRIKELRDHRRRQLGPAGCWDVDEVHSLALGDCVVALANACHEAFRSDARKASFTSSTQVQELQLHVVFTAHALLRQGYTVRHVHKSKYVPPDVWQGDIWEHWSFCFEKLGEFPRTIGLKSEVGDEDGVCF